MIRRLRQSLQIEESYLPETCPFLCKCPTVLYIGSAVEVKATPVPGASKEFLVALIVASQTCSKDQQLHSPSDLAMKSPSDDSNSIGSQGDELDNNSDGRNSGCNSDSDSDTVNSNGNCTTIALQLRPKLNSCGSILCSAGKITANKKVEESTVRLASNPFMVNRSFSLIFLVQQDCYQVIINGEHVMDFCHRVRAESVTHLLLDGDAIFEHVAFYSGLTRPPSILRSNSSIRRFISLRHNVKRYQQQQQQLSTLLASKLCRSSSLPETCQSSTTNSDIQESNFGQQQEEQLPPQQQQVKVKRQAPPPPIHQPQIANNNSGVAISSSVLMKNNDEGSANNGQQQDEKLVVVKENGNASKTTSSAASTNKPRLFVKSSQRPVKSETAGTLMMESKALRTLRPHTLYRTSSLRNTSIEQPAG